MTRIAAHALLHTSHCRERRLRPTVQTSRQRLNFRVDARTSTYWASIELESLLDGDDSLLLNARVDWTRIHIKSAPV